MANQELRKKKRNEAFAKRKGESNIRDEGQRGEGARGG